ncbi:MAG: GIY-YIG nuclease family protein [Candidatus Cyclonatronum sp.]|uniref:GIY-YIG nuclease family protein n=1 Tax=Cyclonatronum sp. TaxID=3024185 RepID=UPI0025C05D80|nr:GIY-YIG nuclease family protein [Cyclonatronum sp.]MCH8487990.1 GIY-YIG nuclease family protein [Cyclonatronum sp.]
MPVPREQLWLLKPDNPLAERLGADFWDAVPKSPGVYVFWSAAGEVLYVGKSGNLRNRLLSYRSARPQSVSRKIIRLIREVSRISWQELPDETAALLEENRLIRLHRPPFNSANKSPETYYYILLSRPAENALGLELRMSVPDGFQGDVFGAFKGHAPVRAALGALNRLLYRFSAAYNGGALPREIVRVLTPRSFTHTFDVPCDSVHRLVRDFLGGQQSGLLQLFEGPEAQAEASAGRFAQNQLQDDARSLSHFFVSRAALNALIVSRFGLRTSLLPQADCDDFRVMLSRP